MVHEGRDCIARTRYVAVDVESLKGERRVNSCMSLPGLEWHPPVGEEPARSRLGP